MATEIGALAVSVSADVGDFIDAFNRADKATEKFSRQLDKRLLDPLAKISAAAAAAGAAVFAFTKGAADMVDELGNLSQKVGVSIQALSGLKYAADLNNVSLDQLGQGLKQLSKFMVENKVEGVSTEEQLLRIADEFAGAADDANKTAVAMKYFGKSGADLIPLLNQGRAGIEELRKEAARLGVVFDEEAAKKANEFNNNLTRLKAAAQGLQVELAGPLVDALNAAAKAMLAAQKAGDGFFATMIQGFQTLVTGDDAHKINKQIVEATDRLLNAQQMLDNAKGQARDSGGAPFDIDQVKKFTAEVVKADAELKKLIAIKSVLAPEAPEAPRKPTKSLKPDGMDEKAIDEVIAEDKEIKKAMSEAEKLARLDEEQAEEEAKTRAEVAALAQQQRDRELQAERDARVLGLDEGHSYNEAELAQMRAHHEARMKTLFEYIDAEQEAEIAKGQAILDAERQFKEEQLRLGYTHNQLNLAAAKTFFGSMSALMNTNSKKMFKIGQAAAIAETIINTHAAAMGAYKAMASIPYVGPALGIAAAAAAMAAGAAQISAIRSQSVGGGGGAVGTFPASPTTGQPAGTPGGDVGPARGGQTAVINITGGEFFSREQVANLLEKINESLGDGGRIVFAR